MTNQGNEITTAVLDRGALEQPLLFDRGPGKTHAQVIDQTLDIELIEETICHGLFRTQGLLIVFDRRTHSITQWPHFMGKYRRFVKNLDDGNTVGTRAFGSAADTKPLFTSHQQPPHPVGEMLATVNFSGTSNGMDPQNTITVRVTKRHADQTATSESIVEKFLSSRPGNDDRCSRAGEHENVVP